MRLYPKPTCTYKKPLLSSETSVVKTMAALPIPPKPSDLCCVVPLKTLVLLTAPPNS